MRVRGCIASLVVVVIALSGIRPAAALDPQCADATIVAAAPGKIVGTSGHDVIRGSSGNDVIYGLDGDDEICGEGGNDQIHGGHGDDIIRGDEGSDTIWGDAGNDSIHGDFPSGATPRGVARTPGRPRKRSSRRSSSP